MFKTLCCSSLTNGTETINFSSSIMSVKSNVVYCDKISDGENCFDLKELKDSINNPVSGSKVFIFSGTLLISNSDLSTNTVFIQSLPLYNFFENKRTIKLPVSATESTKSNDNKFRVFLRETENYLYIVIAPEKFGVEKYDDCELCSIFHHDDTLSSDTLDLFLSGDALGFSIIGTYDTPFSLSTINSTVSFSSTNCNSTYKIQTNTFDVLKINKSDNSSEPIISMSCSLRNEI